MRKEGPDGERSLPPVGRYHVFHLGVMAKRFQYRKVCVRCLLIA